ncbi:MAG: gliding motility-associated C-terminal domain-containing protein [Flavobacteriales bacterium]|jgi:gliding motility-associated-like protein|nr:gliding motility-associated C-terminal domain-containing protein [Flavobacteriales bacterium]
MISRITIALALIASACPLLAQPPACSIVLGPDETICQGETVQLNGPPGFPTYSWSNGDATQNTTVGAAGVYTCTVSYPTGNLAVNPNFSSGNTGFTSMFNYAQPLTTDGNYWIGSNANLLHNQWQGTGNGSFLMVNAGWMHPGFRFWCQTHPVCPGQTYTISFRAMSLATQGPPILAVFVNGSWTGDDMQLPSQQGVWQQFSTTWTAPAGVTSADFCVQVSSGHGIGNDFGFDDVSLSATVTLSDDVEVFVTPLPAFDLGPNVTLCDGETLVLDATVPGGSYLWQDGSTDPTYTVSSAGNYSVTVTANNCTATDAITIGYNPLPVFDLGPDLQLCTGDLAVVDATTPGATYSWMDGSSGATHGVNANGIYGVTVTVNGCSAYDEVVVDYNPLPVVNLGPDQQICAGQQVLLDATEPGATYLWNDGSAGATLTAASTGTYSVTVTLNNCSASDAMDLVVIPLPVVDLGPDQTVCPGTSITLDATLPGAAYAWSNGSGSPSITVSAPGTYSVDVTVNGCSASDALDLVNFSLPVFTLGPDQTICAGDVATFSATVAGASYEWSSGSAANSITTGNAGIYWLDVTTNGCTVRDSVLLTVTPLPLVDLGPDLSLCPGLNATLDATVAGGTYAWSTGGVTPSITVGPGNYDVTVTANGCSASDAIIIGAFPAAQVDLGTDLTLCPGDQVLLDVAQPGASYLWHDGSTAASYTAQSAGVVSVQLTDANGCVATDAINVAVQAPLPVNLGPDADICQGDQVLLDATTPGATAYLWSTGEITPTITVSSTGNYDVTVSQGTCAVSDAIQVTAQPLPVIDLGPDQTICTGDAVTLDASLAGAGYAWSTGAITSSIVVTTGGAYSVTLTNLAGCTYSDQITIVEATADAIDLGPDLVLCDGESAILSAALPGANYLWSTGATSEAITASTSGTYWVQATQGLCSVSDTVLIAVLPMPQVQLPPDQQLCDGESLILDATWPGASYQWSTGESSSSITVQASGSYSVVVDLNGCTATDAVDVAFTVPQAFDLGPDQSLCAGDQATFDPGIAGAIYLWSTGSNAPTITVNASGSYWVQITQGTCVESDTVDVVVLDPGAIELGPAISACDGETVLLDASLPNATYAWSTGATTPTLDVTDSGTYSVTATVGLCSASDDVTVTFLPLPVFDIGPDQSICPGAAATFDATTPNASYLWQDGSTAPTYTLYGEGPVSVTVTVTGCSEDDSANVIALPAPVVNLGNDTTLCSGASLTLSAAQPNAAYAWSTGASTSTISVNAAGTYTVSVDLNGCTASDAINVSVFDPVGLDLGDDQLLCPGESATLAANIVGQYEWSNGAVTASISASSAGTYWVNVTQAACVATDTVVVAFVPLGAPELGAPITLCEGDSIRLSVPPSSASVQWSTGATGDTITVSSSGTYSVTLALQGCSASDEVPVTVLDFIDAITLGTDSTFCPDAPLVLDTGLPDAAHEWSTGSTESFITVSSAGLYTVEVTSDCIDATASIRVVEGICGPIIHVPNTVTPNNDGKNDVFGASYYGPMRDFTLEIFDRWGERIASLDHPDKTWDCTAGGAPVPDGVYVWKIRYRARAEDGAKAEELIGHVNVLR